MPQPIDEKVLSIRDGHWSLPGNRCLDCKEVFHPPRFHCAKCTSPRLEPMELKTTGRIVSYTLVHQTHPESLVPAPYWVALVALDDGPTIEAVCPAASGTTEPRVRALIRLDLYELLRKEGEGQLLAYAFHQVTEGEVTS